MQLALIMLFWSRISIKWNKFDYKDNAVSCNPIPSLLCFNSNGRFKNYSGRWKQNKRNNRWWKQEISSTHCQGMKSKYDVRIILAGILWSSHRLWFIILSVNHETVINQFLLFYSEPPSIPTSPQEASFRNKLYFQYIFCKEVKIIGPRNICTRTLIQVISVRFETH